MVPALLLPILLLALISVDSFHHTSLKVSRAPAPLLRAPLNPALLSRDMVSSSVLFSSASSSRSVKKNPITKVFDLFGNAIRSFFNGIKNLLRRILEIFGFRFEGKSAGSKVRDGVSDAVDDAKNTLRSMGDSASEAADDFTNGAKDLINDVKDK